MRACALLREGNYSPAFYLLCLLLFHSRLAATLAYVDLYNVTPGRKEAAVTAIAVSCLFCSLVSASWLPRAWSCLRDWVAFLDCLQQLCGVSASGVFGLKCHKRGRRDGELLLFRTYMHSIVCGFLFRKLGAFGARAMREDAAFSVCSCCRKRHGVEFRRREVVKAHTDRIAVDFLLLGACEWFARLAS